MGLYFLVFLFELFVAQCIQVKKWRSALWLNAMHSGKKDELENSSHLI